MNDSMLPRLSVVVPVYGSSDLLGELYERVVTTVEKITPQFELILVNDASPDAAWSEIKKLAQKDSRVRGLNLSRNFGQYPAITAGLTASKGEWVVVMDCDLQDQPEGIESLYAKAQEGFLVVTGSRQKRYDSFLRALFSRCFYTTLSYLSGTRQDPTATNFGIYHRQVIDAILSMPDQMRYFSVMVRWVGFTTASVPVEHASRQGGRSGYSFSKLFSLAVDIILAYSDKPLRLIIKIGVAVLFISSIYLVVVIGSSVLSGPVDVPTVLLASLWFIFGSVITILGVMALYLSKIFEQVKQRPLYFVQEEV